MPAPGWNAAVAQEVGVARLRTARIADIVRRRVLRREGEGAQIVEEDIVGHAETGTNDGLVIRRIVNARHEEQNSYSLAAAWRK